MGRWSLSFEAGGVSGKEPPGEGNRGIRRWRGEEGAMRPDGSIVSGQETWTLKTG